MEFILSPSRAYFHLTQRKNLYQPLRKILLHFGSRVVLYYREPEVPCLYILYFIHHHHRIFRLLNVSLLTHEVRLYY